MRGVRGRREGVGEAAGRASGRRAKAATPEIDRAAPETSTRRRRAYRPPAPVSRAKSLSLLVFSGRERASWLLRQLAATPLSFGKKNMCSASLRALPRGCLTTLTRCTRAP